VPPTSPRLVLCFSVLNCNYAILHSAMCAVQYCMVVFSGTFSPSPEALQCIVLYCTSLQVEGCPRICTLHGSCVQAQRFFHGSWRCAGCYIWIGNGPTLGGCMLHNPL